MRLSEGAPALGPKPQPTEHVCAEAPLRHRSRSVKLLNDRVFILHSVDLYKIIQHDQKNN